jgi:hypothetical protein
MNYKEKTMKDTQTLIHDPGLLNNKLDFAKIEAELTELVGISADSFQGRPLILNRVVIVVGFFNRETLSAEAMASSEAANGQ